MLRVVGEQCRYGLAVKGKDGYGPATDDGIHDKFAMYSLTIAEEVPQLTRMHSA